MRTYGAPVILALATAATPAPAAEDPYEQPDRSWIAISGIIAETMPAAFLLDYGNGLITVEIDDRDRYAEQWALIAGDRVTVYGRIDDDLFERATIEAASVYLESLNTYFYGSAADDEEEAEYAYYWASAQPVTVGSATVRGTVTGIDPAQRSFTIDTGRRKLTVETHELGYDPLDAHGFQQIRPGDRVSVSGRIDYEFLDGNVLDAVNVVTLSDGRGDDTAERAAGER